MGGSSPTSTPVQVAPPTFPPGYGFSEAFYSQVLPQLMQQAYPSYGESIDPGLSPTMGALLRGGQTFAAAPFSDSFQQAGSTLGGFMNVNFENPQASVDPNRYGFNYSPEDFQPKPPGPPQGFPQSLQAAAASMGTPMGGQAAQGAPWSGGGPDAGAGYGLATERSRSPFKITPGEGGDPRLGGDNQWEVAQGVNMPGRGGAGFKSNWLYDNLADYFWAQQLRGAGGKINEPRGGVGFQASFTGGGGSGASPNSPSTPGAAPANSTMPAWMKRALLAAGLNVADGAFTDGGGGGYASGGYNVGKPPVPNLGDYNVGNYNPMPGGQGFVDYNPGSPTLNIGPGLMTGTYGPPNPMPPGPYPGPPGGGGGGGAGGGGGGATNSDPNWFGRHRGVNKGKSKEEVNFDMWTRGWPMGDNYTPPPALVKKYEEQGLPTTFGGRQTTQAELAAKARTYGGGGGGGGGGTSPPPQNPSAVTGPGVQAPPMPHPPVYQPPPRATAYSQSGAPAGGK